MNKLLLNALCDRFVAPELVNRMADRIAKLSNDYETPLWAWVYNGECRNVSLKGHSTDELMSEYNLGYPQALSLIIWLDSDPNQAQPVMDAGFKDLCAAPVHK